jgi:hypothetical protein
MKVECNNNVLNVGGLKLEFDNKIVEVKQSEKYIFVRTEVAPNVELNKKELSNVYAIDNYGQLVWQIKNNPPENNPQFICAPIVGLDVDSLNNLYVTDFMGRRFEVSEKDGSLQNLKIVK